MNAKDITQTQSMAGFSSYPQVRFEEFIEGMKASLPRLPRQEAKLAQYMVLNQNTLALENGKTLAAKVGVSEVTVGRLLRRLGCNGIRGLKELLRHQYSEAHSTPVDFQGVDLNLEKVMEAEMSVVAAVFQQTSSKNWKHATRLLTESDQVFITGFQSVRGIAEDFSRRLLLARAGVSYLSPHDNMLGEWTDDADGSGDCLVLIDVVPYAREAVLLARLARERGKRCIVVTDEYCHWGREVADAVIHAPSKTGLFLESTVGIVLALSLLVGAVSTAHPEESEARMLRWKAHTRQLNLF
ncbi:MAG TPA: MurR/RpiR family transcriptional regulator [Burkholderiaceae bacterium]|nr:MurR/RpiR family transcriptional regulator [Burkholderiaceae bacterium]